MPLAFDTAGTQIDGDRDYQEDNFLVTHLKDSDGAAAMLIIISDGMGGHAAGNVASNMAVQAFNKHLSANYPTNNLGKVLKESIQEANLSIKETVKETPALKGMGCTMVVGILETGKIWWASVGDSHLYHIRNSQLNKLNADHSYGGFLARMEAAGQPVAPDSNFSRNMLMSAITGDVIDEIDISEKPMALSAGDTILIASDGLDTLKIPKIVELSQTYTKPKDYVAALMEEVKKVRRPRQDNTTAVAVSVFDESDTTNTAASKTQTGVQSSIMDETALQRIKEIVAKEKEAKQNRKKGGRSIGLIIGLIVTIGASILGYQVYQGKPIPFINDKITKSKDTDTSTTTVTQDSIPTESSSATEKTLATTKTSAKKVAETDTKQTKPVADAKPKAEKSTAPKKLTAGVTFQDNLKIGGEAPLMIVVPAGQFDMGSPNSSSYTSERPRHKVTIEKPFAVSVHEITFEEFEKYAKAEKREIPNNLYMEKKTHPVIFITWDEAFYYTKWLSKQTGGKYRLPSEAEWEYFASTGKRSTFWWGYKEEANKAHCFGCGTGLDPRKPTKIGSFKPNAFGLYDTAGNVSEWVYDCWHKNYNNAPDTGEVWEGGDCHRRTVRGGAYSSPIQSLRNARRDSYPSTTKQDHIGIRIVRDL